MIGFSETAVGVLLVSCWAGPAGTVMMLLEVMDMVLGPAYQAGAVVAPEIGCDWLLENQPQLHPSLPLCFCSSSILDVLLSQVPIYILGLMEQR
jgi:hypothetical protein